MKSMAYDIPVTSEGGLITRVHGAIESRTRQPQLLVHVSEAHYRRYKLCKGVGGTHVVM